VILTLHLFKFNYKHDLCHFLVVTELESHKDPSLLFTLDLKGFFVTLIKIFEKWYFDWLLYRLRQL